MQIVSAHVNTSGNFVVEFKALPKGERISGTGKTVQIAGTNGWSEPLGLLYPSETTGENMPLNCKIYVSYTNPAVSEIKPEPKKLTMADLLAAANKGKVISKPTVQAAR